MTLGNGGAKVSIPDNLVKIVVYTVAILGVGYGVAVRVNHFDDRQRRLESRFDTFIFDLCSHLDPVSRLGYRSCVDNTLSFPLNTSGAP